MFLGYLLGKKLTEKTNNKFRLNKKFVFLLGNNGINYLMIKLSLNCILKMHFVILLTIRVSRFPQLYFVIQFVSFIVSWFYFN